MQLDWLGRARESWKETSSEQSRELIEQARQIRRAARRLSRLLVQVPSEPGDGSVKPPPKSDQSLFAAAAPVTFANVKGQLVQAKVFVSNCVRDLPDVVAKTGFRPTPADRARIDVEAVRIMAGAELIVPICENGPAGGVKEPTDNGLDRLCVGQRYAPSLDPLIERMPELAGYCMPKSPNFEGVARDQFVRRRPKEGKLRRRRK
jgi:hypothetical protein